MREIRCVAPAALSFAAIVLCSTPAAAQYGAVQSSAAIGERYHIEAAMSWWNPEPTLIVSSESLGIEGTDVDLVNDLGIEQERFRELRLVLRPGTKHKFRFAYLPLKYAAEGAVQREFVFNGKRYPVNLPVNTTADLTTYRFGYEYDFLYRSRGYLGVLLDLKYTNVDVVLENPLIGREFTSQVAPIPTIGVAGRAYLVDAISITGELTFFKIPDKLGEQFEGGGRYFDYDVYSTFNFTNYVGAQLGLRSVDVDYFKDLDSGSLEFRGWYFGGVIRY